MAVRAVWNLGDLSLEDEGEDPVQDIMALAKPIDLSKSTAQLNEELSRLMKQEARLSDVHGVECERKWGADHSCYDCAFYRGDDTEGHEGVLCRLGRRQEDKVEEIETRHALDETAVNVETVMLREECEELADFALAI